MWDCPIIGQLYWCSYKDPFFCPSLWSLPTVQETSVFSLLYPTGILFLLIGAGWVWCHFWFAFPKSSLVWSILSSPFFPSNSVRKIYHLKWTSKSWPCFKFLFHELFWDIAWGQPLDSERPLCSVTQSCLTLCDPMNCSSPPGSTAHGIFQARIWEWVAISYSRRSPWPRDATLISWFARQIFFTTDPPRKPWRAPKDHFTFLHAPLWL